MVVHHPVMLATSVAWGGWAPLICMIKRSRFPPFVFDGLHLSFRSLSSASAFANSWDSESIPTKIQVVIWLTRKIAVEIGNLPTPDPKNHNFFTSKLFGIRNLGHVGRWPFLWSLQCTKNNLTETPSDLKFLEDHPRTSEWLITIRIGLWDPFQMALPWPIKGGDPNH